MQKKKLARIFTFCYQFFERAEHFILTSFIESKNEDIYEMHEIGFSSDCFFKHYFFKLKIINK
jgi:hypothetical protein